MFWVYPNGALSVSFLFDTERVRRKANVPILVEAVGLRVYSNGASPWCSQLVSYIMTDVRNAVEGCGGGALRAG